MGIYRTTIAGRQTPVLIKAETQAKAKDRVVTEIKALTAEEMEEALTAGEPVWRDGEDFPADQDAAKSEAEQESRQDKGD